MKPQPPISVKLFAGLLYTNQDLQLQALERLIGLFGQPDHSSEVFTFDCDYYAEEMGADVVRRFVSFAQLVDPGNLPGIKLRTNEIEDVLAIDGKRKVNIDPGYLDFNKVILASAKQNAQKIYLTKGIYADPVLWYEKGRFRPSAWAFPDFKSGMYEKTFLQMRALFKAGGGP